MPGQSPTVVILMLSVVAVLHASTTAGAPFCGQQANGITTPGATSALFLDLECPLAGDKIDAVEFASYGVAPSGACGSYTKPESCDAENSSAIVAAACVGAPSCRVWPNSTTFGDPCFGTVKQLVVQARCVSGPGVATPGCDATRGACPSPPTPTPAPPPPPAPVAAAATVTVDWASVTGPLATEPSLQVVAHGLLMRDSPLHDKLFGLLRDLGAKRVRYVPWLPTPLLGVAALEPPSADATSWNFTLLDEHFLDTWHAVQGGGNLGHAMIPNFSTPPTWLYDGADWGYSKECSQANGCKSGGYEKGTAPASFHGGLEALGDYYGRLVAWYTQGGFTDELGKRHTSGHFLNITIWEIFNEPDYEHGHTAESYTLEFDAIVAGIRRHADPGKKIQFVGMNNPNIDDEAKVVEWARYFLNASNHAPEARDALDYIGYHVGLERSEG